MSFRSCWTWVEIFCDPLGHEIRATFEVPPSDSFEKGGNARATQELVGKADAIGLVPHGV